MATEEIEISELEYRENLSGDDLMPVETSTNTFATSLTQIKDWLKSFFVSKIGDESIDGLKKFEKGIQIGNQGIRGVSAGGNTSVLWQDKNNETISFIQSGITTSGGVKNFINYAVEKKDGSGFGEFVSLYEGDNGTEFYFPQTKTPATTTSSANTGRVNTVVQNYKNGNTWFRKWSDGWIEQGGFVSANIASDFIFNFPFPFATDDVNVVNSQITIFGTCGYIYRIKEITKQRVVFANYSGYSQTGIGWNGRIYFYACGY